MLILLSPAKTLDFTSEIPPVLASEPELLSYSSELATLCKQLTPQQIASLMKISDTLAGLNAARFASWNATPTQQEGRQAIYAFKGDVYQGLEATTLSESDILFAQQHLRILSGLYGLLRPLDNMLPYRLEMGSKLANPKGKDLYHFWQTTLTAHLNSLIQRQQVKLLVNLASVEYSKAVSLNQLATTVITPTFLDQRDGEYKIISFYAKKARGLMTRFIIQNRIDSMSALKEFNLNGYYFCEASSNAKQLTFKRDRL